MKPLSQISPRNDIMRPVLEFAGNNVNYGILTGLLSYLPHYLVFNHIAKSNGLKDHRKRAALLAVPFSGVFGAANSWATAKRYGDRKYQNGEDFANHIIGTRNGPWSYSKTGSDYSFNKGTLLQGVDEMNITDSQRDFLVDGIKFSPGNSATTLWGLGDGFSQAVDDRTGGLLPRVTRAVEGGIIGGAFGNLLGLSPENKKWAVGVGATLESLYGSKLFNAIGGLL